jgi:hypothetical protein
MNQARPRSLKSILRDLRRANRKMEWIVDIAHQEGLTFEFATPSEFFFDKPIISSERLTGRTSHLYATLLFRSIGRGGEVRVEFHLLVQTQSPRIPSLATVVYDAAPDRWSFFSTSSERMDSLLRPYFGIPHLPELASFSEGGIKRLRLTAQAAEQVIHRSLQLMQYCPDTLKPVLQELRTSPFS